MNPIVSLEQLEKAVIKDGPLICEHFICPVCRHEETNLHQFKERVGLQCGHAAATTWEAAFAALGGD